MNMNSNTFRRMVFVLFFLIPFQMFAQEKEESAANVNKIATMTDGKVGEFLKTTSNAQLKRNNQNDWSNVNKHEELYFNDILRLEKNIWLQVNIKNKIQKGNLSILPNPKNLNESGRYEIIKAEDGSGGVAIKFIQGVGIINVMNNKISTITGGIESAVRSGSTSRALFSVNSNNSGEIYLQQGHLTFPGNNKFGGLQEGQVAQFKDGEITNVFFPDALALSEYNDFIKFNNTTIWKKPFFKQPAVWIGAATIVTGATILIINGSKQKNVTGTINVNWGGN